MADLPITSDEGGTPVVVTGTISPFSTLAIATNGSFQTLADNTGTGTIIALNGTVVANTHGCSSVAFNVTGTWVATITIQATSDGTNWNIVNGNILATDNTTQTFANNEFLVVPCGGFQQVRLIATAFTSGTISVAWNSGAGSSPVFTSISPVAASFQTTARLNDGSGNSISSTSGSLNVDVTTALPAGTNNIGNVGVAQGSTTSGETGPLIQGAVTTANPSYTTAQTSPLSLDTSGNLRVTITGSGGGSSTVVGTKSNNSVVPGSTNLGVLPALANAASPSWTEGDQVLESVDLTGRQRFRGVLSNNTAAPDTDGIMNLSAISNAANPSYTEGNLVLLSTDLSGNLRVALQPTTKSTYSATTLSLTPGATPTDIVTIIGSATKTIRVLKFDISASQTTLGINTWYLIKRSTANTGGTSTTSTAVPFDSNDSAATATFTKYTANPTSLGTAVGTIATLKLVADPTVGGTPSQVVYTYDFTDNGTAQGIVLRGTAQVFALNFNGAALPAGLAINVNILWTEE